VGTAVEDDAALGAEEMRETGGLSPCVRRLGDRVAGLAGVMRVDPALHRARVPPLFNPAAVRGRMETG
jgi:hypothetical protein